MERVPFLATEAAALYEGLRLPVSILLDNVRSTYNVGRSSALQMARVSSVFY